MQLTMKQMMCIQPLLIHSSCLSLKHPKANQKLSFRFLILLVHLDWIPIQGLALQYSQRPTQAIHW
jgi:hypothetical protein